MSNYCTVKGKQQVSNLKEKEDERSLFYVCQSALEQKNYQWIIDNACKNHMTTNKKLFFFNYLDTNIKSRVNIDNGDLIEANGLGAT